MTSMASGTNAHLYLGELEDLEASQQSYYADGQVLELPVIHLPQTIIFPGSNLPLRALSSHVSDTLRQRLQSRQNLIAVINQSVPGSFDLAAGHAPNTFQYIIEDDDERYGSTIRIERMSIEEESVVVTGVAKQRCVALDTMSSTSLIGRVQILPTHSPPRLPFSLLPYAHYDTPAKREKVSRRFCFLRFPTHVQPDAHFQFDAYALIDRIQKLWISSFQLQQIRSEQGDTSYLDAPIGIPSSVTKDPVRFAYWVASALPLDHSQRRELFKIDCIVQLLRQELTLLQHMQDELYCERCNEHLASTEQLFLMSSADTFVNPHGFVHQLLTFRNVLTDRLYSTDEFSTQESWFPGYSWSIIHCRRCFAHLGWRFDRTDESLHPACFYGFRQTSLTPFGDPEEM